MNQWDFTSPFEGVVNHLYLDSRGLPTCGVGFMITNVAALQRLPWQPSRTVVVDYQNLLHAPTGHSAEFYRPMTAARLDDASMRIEFDNRVGNIRQLLSRLGWQLERCPEPAQIAIVDMAYNLGVGGLARFVKFRDAIVAQDWNAAATESHRFGVQDARNVATASAFNECALAV